jgi:4-carboxymuconolactone decarboxylase
MNDNSYEAGMKVRRQVLGDAHVDRANARITDVNREFQDFITRFGWGEIWTRPQFDHRTRRILVMGTMVALGCWEEFRMHLRAALEDGMSLSDVREILLQQAIYCGFPVANTAFQQVEGIMNELKSRGVPIVED